MPSTTQASALIAVPVKLILLAVLSTLQGQAQVNILTGNGNNDRTNANLREIRLSPATVNPSTFGKLGAFQVDGQVYGQPLYVSGLSIPGNGKHNVLFVSTMHNSVYAFDADMTSSVSLLWHVNLGPSVPANLLFGKYGDIAVEVGILSTGVIDLQRGLLYVIADVLEFGRPAFYLHALDLTTGAERLNGPAPLTATVTGTGSAARADGTIAFDPLQHIQRPSLLLANDSVYIGFGSHGDQDPYHGWMFRYGAMDLSPLGVYVSTPNGNGGAFWQSGRGPAADPEGNVYAITGNGDYDGIHNFGESILKISPKVSGVVDAFTPSDWKSLSDNDFDLSAGPALVTGTHTLIGADKGGTLYVLDGNAMSSGATGGIISASPGTIFNFAVWSRRGSARVYTQGERDPLKCFEVTGNVVTPNPISVAANPVRFTRIGMTLSANGEQEGSGILWETIGDYNAGTAGALHAYDASNLAIELWNSNMNPARDQMAQITKFVSPTVANGKVYVPNSDNVVLVYGILVPAAIPPPGEHDRTRQVR